MAREFNLPGDAILRERIQQDLPNCPEDVIEQWLMPVALYRGSWPPLGEKGRNVLAQRTLDFWRQVRWSAEPVNVLFLTPSSLERINGIIEAHVHGQDNVFARMEGSRERFYGAVSYIEEHGRLPGPPVPLVEDGLQFEAIDGNHRLAAYFHLKCRFQPCCWVGRGFEY